MQNGFVAADAAATSNGAAAASVRPTVVATVAATKANHDAREAARRQAEAKLHVERRADQLQMQEAYEAADAAAGGRRRSGPPALPPGSLQRAKRRSPAARPPRLAWCSTLRTRRRRTSYSGTCIRGALATVWYGLLCIRRARKRSRTTTPPGYSHGRACVRGGTLSADPCGCPRPAARPHDGPFSGSCALRRAPRPCGRVDTGVDSWLSESADRVRLAASPGPLGWRQE